MTSLEEEPDKISSREEDNKSELLTFGKQEEEFYNNDKKSKNVMFGRIYNDKKNKNVMFGRDVETWMEVSHLTGHLSHEY